MSDLKATLVRVRDYLAAISRRFNDQHEFTLSAEADGLYLEVLDALTALSPVQEGPRPDTHNHEQGAPLVSDCDGWCRAKYRRWQRRMSTAPPAQGAETA